MNMRIYLTPVPFDPFVWCVPIHHQISTPDGTFILPANAKGLVLFVHTDVGSHWAPCHRRFARVLVARGFAVFQMEPPPKGAGRRPSKEELYLGQIAERLASVIQHAQQQPRLRGLSIVCLGFGVGGTAALMAAGEFASAIDALVVVDGGVELIEDWLANVLAATLLAKSDAQNIGRRMTQTDCVQPGCGKEMGVAPASTLGNRDREERVAVPMTARFQQRLKPQAAFFPRTIRQ
jgi:pimeloyl-ACP methyl ester carboxylesterase